MSGNNRNTTDFSSDFSVAATACRQFMFEAADLFFEFTEVTIPFFKDGAHFSTLTSDSGLANLLTHDIHTWGSVIVVTEDGRRLDTEELFFSNETQLIHNDVYNVFTRGQDVMTGIGLEATPDLEYIEIKQQVEAQVKDQAEGEG